MVSDVVQHYVVALRLLGEVFLGVVDDVVGADRVDHVGIACAARVQSVVATPRDKGG